MYQYVLPSDLSSIDFTMSQSGNVVFLISVSSIMGNYSLEHDLFELREIMFEF